MKLRKLLVLGAALFMTGVASADLVERQKPVFELGTPVEAPTDGATYVYMYNVGAKKFFTGANNWGTHASVGEFEAAYKVTFKQYVAAGAEWDGVTVEFLDSCKAKSNAVKNVFIDNVGGDCYVDKGNQANFYWNLAKNADNAYYRLSMGVASPDYQTWQVDTYPDTYFGNNDTLKSGDWGNNPTPGSTTLAMAFMNPKDPNTGELNPHVHVDWAFVSLEEGAAFQAVLDVYNAAETLKGVIADAQAKGLDVAAAEAVYNNASATVADLNAAAATLRTAMDALVDVNNPVNKTDLIVNPSYDNNDNTGWSGTTPKFQSYDDAEHYNTTFDTWQLLTGLPNGVYKLYVQGFYRPATADAKGAVFYAANGVDSLIVDVPNIDSATELENKPNNMQSAGDAFHAGHYGVELFFSVVDNQARIGVKMPATTGGSDWVIWDNWQLTYYGSKPEAYALWLDNVKANAPKFAEDAVATAGMIEEYNKFVQSFTGSDYETVMTASRSIQEKAAAVEENVAAWADYMAELERSQEFIVSPDLDPDCEYLGILGEYVDITAVDEILPEMALDTEGVKAELQALAKMMNDAATGCLPLNAEVTNVFLTNFNFDTKESGNDGKGWEGNWTAINESCMEAYELTWDAYQIVENAPVGIYEVSLQGFYRAQRGTNAYNAYLNGEQVSPGGVYVNNNLVPFKCIFDEALPIGQNIYSGTTSGDEGNFCRFWSEELQDSIVTPNDMKSAGEAFAAGMYKSTANGIVAKQGDVLRLGIKGNKVSATWAIWDSFKMVFRGKQPEYVSIYLTEAIANADKNLTGHIGKEVKELVQSRKAAGEAAMGAADGDAMFEALVALYDLGDTVTVSTAAIEPIYDAAQGLFTHIESAVAGATVQAEAATLAETIITGIDNCTYATAEMPELQAQIDAMIMKLITPDGVATDDAPFDLTKAIKNPTFDKDGSSNSVEGWTIVDNNQGYGNGDETQALIVEFYERKFDMYQDINGLQEGTYRIEVSSFNRNGTTANDFNLFASGEAVPVENGCLYAVSGGVEYSTPLALIASGAVTEDPGVGSTYTDEVLGTVYYYPNAPREAKSFFEAGYYKNVLYANVTDGTLRIGVKKTADHVSNDWAIFDDFKLFYLGAESQYKDAASIEDVLSTAKVVEVEFFNINGAQINGLQKGLNIIKSTLEDGTVVVSKKLVK